MKKSIIAVATVLLSTAGAAQAQDIKPYAGIGVGMFGLELKAPGVNQKNSVLGGYAKFGADFNDYIGAELRIGTTGTGTSSYPIGTPVTISPGLTIPSPIPFSFSMKADYFISYLAKPQIKVADDFRVYGLLGGTTARVTGDFSVAGIPGVSGTMLGFSYGAGAEYKLADRLNVGAEWVQYWTDVKTGTTSTARIWGIVGSLRYSF